MFRYEFIDGDYSWNKDWRDIIASAARFIEHESKLRELRTPIYERLNSIPLPATLERLYSRELLVDWHTPGAVMSLFPGLAQTPVEPGVDLSLVLSNA